MDQTTFGGITSECDVATIENFLTFLFPTGTRGYLNLWTDAGHRSTWFDLSDEQSLHCAAKHATAVRGTQQLWLMTGLTAHALGERRKGMESEIVMVPGLHADVDWLHPVHKCTQLPPTLEDARQLIDEALLPPTLIVNSGHGLQPYWLFDQPVDVSTPEARARIKNLLVRWQAHLREMAKAHGWHLDSTANLDRLMRIVGTNNRKSTNFVPVTLLEQNGARYSVEQLELVLDAHENMADGDLGLLGATQDSIERQPPVQRNSKALASPSTRPSRPMVDELCDDDRIIDNACGAANGSKFRQLYEAGDATGYKSVSEAVEALACLLAFWTRDPLQIKRIMDRSTLCRDYDKWQRPDFPDLSISKALATVTAHHDPLHEDASAKRNSAKVSQTDVLVSLCDHVELFHDAQGVAYASVPVQQHRETYPIKSDGFTNWLLGCYWQQSKKAPSQKAKQEALETIAARAQFEGRRQQTAIRLAEHEGRVYLDLCNDTWEAVEITSTGWNVISTSPVRFIRKAGMLPLPMPLHGGSIDQLRPLINAAEDDNWRLIVSWLIGSLRPRGPYPLLILNGEQGSAKSTTSKMLRALVDPHVADLRAAPRQEHDLIIAAANSRTVGFDNMSGVQPWLSDALCRLATGAAYGTRTLYSDDEEKLFAVARPCLINGIEDLAGRADLLERAIHVTLPTIPPCRRRTETELWRQFELTRPAILGALLDAVVAALGHMDQVAMEDCPRMADFAQWVAAAEFGNSLPWSQGQFIRSYQTNQKRGQAAAIENAAIGSIIHRLLERHGGQWTGTVGVLLDTLDSMADMTVRRHLDWPKTSRGLSGQLRRLAPSFRAAGIEIEFGNHGEHGKKLMIKRSNPSGSSPEINLSLPEPLQNVA